MLSKLRSRNLTPKPPKVPLWKKKRKPLNRKRTFKAQNNETKTYTHKRTPEAVQRFAEECRKSRLRAPTAAEEAFAGIMDQLGIEYEREVIKYYANGRKFVIFDFLLTSSNVVIELDGCAHEGQKKYDAGRDKYFESIGIRTIRFTNKEVLKTSGAVAEKVRMEVG